MKIWREIKGMAELPIFWFGLMLIVNGVGLIVTSVLRCLGL